MSTAREAHLATTPVALGFSGLSRCTLYRCLRTAAATASRFEKVSNPPAAKVKQAVDTNENEVTLRRTSRKPIR
jgi:uncharacterized membrane protein